LPVLIIQTEKGEKSYNLGKEPVTIGRSPASSVQISDPASSRKHCIVKSSGEAVVVVDLGSANGTKVNNKKITREQVLHAGDMIQIGKTVIRYIDDRIA